MAIVVSLRLAGVPADAFDEVDAELVQDDKCSGTLARARNLPVDLAHNSSVHVLPQPLAISGHPNNGFVGCPLAVGLRHQRDQAAAPSDARGACRIPATTPSTMNFHTSSQASRTAGVKTSPSSDSSSAQATLWRRPYTGIWVTRLPLPAPGSPMASRCCRQTR